MPSRRRQASRAQEAAGLFGVGRSGAAAPRLTSVGGRLRIVGLRRMRRAGWRGRGLGAIYAPMSPRSPRPAGVAYQTEASGEGGKA